MPRTKNRVGHTQTLSWMMVAFVIHKTPFKKRITLNLYVLHKLGINKKEKLKYEEF